MWRSRREVTTLGFVSSLNQGYLEDAMLRKSMLARPKEPAVQGTEIPIASVATVYVTSEAMDHPIDHAFDNQYGPGGTRWVAQEPGEQAIIVAFDTPQSIHQVTLEVEEQQTSRTQELQLAISTDGQTYRELRRQEYTFSPKGATFEREEWTLQEEDVTHLRLWIKPDKGDKACHASLTSLALR